MRLEKLWFRYRIYRTLSESSLFDREYYASKVYVPERLTVLHYMFFNRKRMADPSPEFEEAFYLDANPDVKASGMPALYHYLAFGRQEGRKTGWVLYHRMGCPMYQMFDGRWYRETYLSQKEKRGVEPFFHYLEVGWREGYLPFREFDRERFLEENPDCAEEPLQYWYSHRLTGLYFTDTLELDMGRSRLSRSAESAIHYRQDERIDEFLNGQKQSNGLQLLIVPIPERSSPGTLLDFQKYYAQCLQEGNRRVLAVTAPGQRSFPGEGLFGRELPVFRFEQLQSRLQVFSSVQMVLYEDMLEYVLGYYRYNTDDALLHEKQKTVRILNTCRSGDVSLQKGYLRKWFDQVTEEERIIEEPGDNPLLGFFDPEWYRRTYLAGTEEEDRDSREEYLETGWRRRRRPFFCFDIDRFYAEHPDCRTEPLFYCECNRIGTYYFTQSAIPQMKLSQQAGQALQRLYRIRQESMIEQFLPYENTEERLLLFVLTPEDAISGGIMSFYGMYHLSRQMEQIHHRRVIAVSIPGDTTHAGYTMFKNDMPVFRYDMVQRRMNQVKDILVMLPELYAEEYADYLRTHSEDPILRVPSRHLNLLNQRIELMPEPKVLRELELYFPKVTQTVGHYRYCTERERTYYGIPQHLLLPPIIKEFTKVSYARKEEIFAYSYDEKPWKEALLGVLKQEFPGLQFVEIRGLTFDEYLALIHRAKWCMTFGEGLDGYFSEPYETGGISFAVWNDRYFTERYHHLPTVLDSVEDAMSRLPELMRSLDDPETYEKTSNLIRCVHDQEYAGKRTSRDQLQDFFEGRYDFP